MTICHIIIKYYIFCVEFLHILNNKGLKMSILIKNAENLFEKFEKTCEEWAEKLF